MSNISQLSLISENDNESTPFHGKNPGNPAVIGLGGFGLTTILLQIHNLGLAGLGPVIWTGFIFGGLAQMIAGFQEQKVGNNFGSCAFTGYGCFWIALAAMLVAKKYDLFPISNSDLAWFLAVWGLFSALLLVGSIKINKAMFFTFATLTVGFFLLSLEHFGFGEELGKIAAYDLLLCAALAWYMMAAIIYRDLFSRDILPVGRPLL
jgi:succinate-acetate transporter protein